MIFSNCKIARRNLLKRKGFSLLNLAGLAIGITNCLLIFHYVLSLVIAIPVVWMTIDKWLENYA